MNRERMVEIYRLQERQERNQRWKLAQKNNVRAERSGPSLARVGTRRTPKSINFDQVGPYENFDEDQANHDSIFVSIPSYRDPECHRTLSDLFEKAKYPGRVFVGVCQQNEPEDIDCMQSKTAHRFQQNIRIMTIPSGEAKGPMFARYLIEQYLYQDEMFFLQIDSHMLFIPGWDEELIYQLALCDSERPILTTYPQDFDRETRRLPPSTLMPTFLRYRGFHERLGFTQQEKRAFARLPPVPQPSLYWAAGFSFTLGEAVRQVPYDPHCPYVFLGEEMSMSMRFFTKGWDFFAPMKNVVFHITKRTYRPTFWEQVYKKNCVVDDETRLRRKEMEADGVERITRLIYGELDDPVFGLGNDRTIEDWERFVGVDIIRCKGTKRSYYGLMPDASPEEQLIKLGRIMFAR